MVKSSMQPSAEHSPSPEAEEQIVPAQDSHDKSYFAEDAAGEECGRHQRGSGSVPKEEDVPPQEEIVEKDPRLRQRKGKKSAGGRNGTGNRKEEDEANNQNEDRSRDRRQEEEDAQEQARERQREGQRQYEVEGGEPVIASDEDFVHFEGEMHKYKPGMSAQYILRWCQATPSHFNYYKSHWSANCWLSKPLMSVPYSCIQTVRRVDVRVPNRKRRVVRGKEQRMPQLEIFLKKDVDVTLLSKSIDYSAYETRCVAGRKHPTGRNSLSCVAAMRAKRNSAPNLSGRPLESRMAVAEPMSAQKGRHPRCRSGGLEALAKIGEDMSKMQSVCTPEKAVIDGHLMRTPSTYSKSRDVSTYNYLIRRSLELNASRVEETPVEEDDMIFVSKRQLSRFRAFSEKYEAELLEVVLNEKIGTHNPSAWIPTLASKGLRRSPRLDPNTWTNRECEWFAAENRFLFACESEEMCNKWVVILNWLMAEAQHS